MGFSYFHGSGSSVGGKSNSASTPFRLYRDLSDWGLLRTWYLCDTTPLYQVVKTVLWIHHFFLWLWHTEYNGVHRWCIWKWRLQPNVQSITRCGCLVAGTVLISIRETTCSAAAAMPAILNNPSDAYFARQKVNPYTNSCVTLGTACPTFMKQSHAWQCREGVLYLSTDLHSEKQQGRNRLRHCYWLSEI